MTEMEAKQTVRLTNIQRFSLHDGPGIRTTVFLKGCPLHCPWCANPENIRYERETWRKSDGTSGVFGYDITLSDLQKELLKDCTFYLDGGGVTFSGGEPLLQIDRYEPLLQELKQNHIHLALETALFVDQGKVEIAQKYFDWWYVDMKVLEPGICRQILGGNIWQYLENLSWLINRGVALCIRIPCVCGVTDTKENLVRAVSLLQELQLKQIEIFAIHDLAKNKYDSLDRKWTVDVARGEAAVNSVKSNLEAVGIHARVIRI